MPGSQRIRSGLPSKHSPRPLTFCQSFTFVSNLMSQFFSTDASLPTQVNGQRNKLKHFGTSKSLKVLGYKFIRMFFVYQDGCRKINWLKFLPVIKLLTKSCHWWAFCRELWLDPWKRGRSWPQAFRTGWPHPRSRSSPRRCRWRCSDECIAPWTERTNIAMSPHHLIPPLGVKASISLTKAVFH